MNLLREKKERGTGGRFFTPIPQTHGLFGERLVIIDDVDDVHVMVARDATPERQHKVLMSDLLPLRATDVDAIDIARALGRHIHISRKLK